MIAFAINTQARINDTNYTFGQGKSYDSSNFLKKNRVTKGGNSLGQVYPFLAVILFSFYVCD